MLPFNVKQVLAAVWFAACVSFLSGCSTIQAKHSASLGTYHFGQPNYEKAAEYFEDAAAHDPENKNHLGMLGWSQFKLGQYDQAIAAFEKLERVDPKSVEAFTGQGWSNFKKLDYDRAINFFKKALEADRDSSDALSGLGWCYSSKQDYPKAERYFNAALRKGMKYHEGSLLKTEPEAHRGLGYLKFTLGDYETAAQHLRRAAVERPDWMDAREKLGDSLSALKEYEEALKVYRRAIWDAEVETAVLYDKAAWSYYYLEGEENFEKAEEMFQEALAIDPNYASSLSGLEALKAKLGTAGT